MKNLLLIPAALFLLASCNGASKEKEENKNYNDTTVKYQDSMATDTNTIREKAKKLDDKIEGDHDGGNQGAK